jgi:uncharacterized protein (DUF58 family)
MLDFIPFLVILMVVAALVNSDSVMTVFYMIFGIILLGLWWNQHGIRHIKVSRKFDDHAFLYQKSELELQIENTSILPIVWLEIHESLPVNVRNTPVQNYVISLPPKGKYILKYPLYTLKRGFYKLGPTSISSGDILGITHSAEVFFEPDHFIVYPNIVNFERLILPSRSPFGFLKHKDPIFEDPSRIFGKRNYQEGDPLSRIDWKSSASTGELQVKIFEPAITMETLLVLDLDPESYDIKKRFDATELAITSAASIANWSSHQKLTIGLLTNGLDPLNGLRPVLALPAQKGSQHVMMILEALAKVEVGQTSPVTSLISQAFSLSAWGTTLILITGQYYQQLLEQIIQAKQNGLNIVLMLIGFSHDRMKAQSESRQYGFTLYFLQNTIDLDMIQY